MKKPFGLKLKDDFMKLFLLEQYSNVGLPDDFVMRVISDKKNYKVKET